MLNKKEIIIVVQGVMPLSYWPMWIQKIMIFLSGVFSFQPVMDDFINHWEKKLNSENRKVIWFDWARDIAFISKFLAVKKLKRLIKKLKDHDIKIIGISWGGQIVMGALKNNKQLNVKKVVLICSTNRTGHFDSREFNTINLYSMDDKFADFVIGFFSFFRGKKALSGTNVKNISLPEMTHADFCLNKQIQKGRYKGKTPSELVDMFLEEKK